MPATKRPASQSVDISLDAFRASRPRTNPRDSLPCQPPQLPLETPSKQRSESAGQSQSVLASDQGNLLSKSKTSISVTSTDTVRQDTIKYLLRSELNGAVWHDPNFFQKALPCSDDLFAAIRNTCEGLNSARTAWSSLPPTGPEVNFYAPILELMNAIGRATHAVVPDLGVYVEFQDSSKRRLVSNDPSTSTYPDIIRCELPNALTRLQWQDLDTFVEVKKDKGGTKQAIEQSSRYARALLGHRFDRRSLKTLVVCGTVAIFLLFDRSGLVYSDELDIYTDALKFIRSFAGLLLLKGVHAGYNPMFNNLWGQSASGESTLVRLVTTKNGLYKVLAVLCNRMAIRSRATLVLAIRELSISRLETNVSYREDRLAKEALKMTWWDQTRFPEGVILQQFRGMYGVSQIIDYGDVMFDGHRDIVYSRKDLVPGPLEGLFGKQKENVDIKGAQRDDSRVYVWTLAVRGRPLTEASDPSELVAGIMGALMGHWALVNSQVQHRDISLGNILLAMSEEYPHDENAHTGNTDTEHTSVEPDEDAAANRDEEPEWQRLQKLGAERCAREFKIPEWDVIFNRGEGPPKYKKAEKLEWNFNPMRRLVMLERVIEKLGRDEPFGFLSDLDMANILSIRRDQASDMHTHRTGTLSFMARQLLRAPATTSIPHTYLHDLESFFWVLLYVVADHREGDAPPNENAKRVINQLGRLDRQVLGDTKVAILALIDSGELDIASFRTSWAIALAPVIEDFARWLLEVGQKKFDSAADPDACFEDVLDIFIKYYPELGPSPIMGETPATPV